MLLFILVMSALLALIIREVRRYIELCDDGFGDSFDFEPMNDLDRARIRRLAETIHVVDYDDIA